MVFGHRFGLLPVHSVLSEDPLGDPFRCPQVVWYTFRTVLLTSGSSSSSVVSASCVPLLSRWDLVGCPQFDAKPFWECPSIRRLFISSVIVHVPEA